MASPAASGSAPSDPVRALQHTLYRTAKMDAGRRFHALGDKVIRSDVLMRAWFQVYRNQGASGVDRITVDQVKEYGVTRLLDELASELREGRYRPLPARRVLIPKPGTLEQRPLSIPAVRDRIVQAACKIVLEPIFEADMCQCSFGFRPRRSAHDALQVLVDEAWRGRRWVVETDIAKCFEAIPHDRLMQAVEERVCDQSVLRLLRVMLRAGVMSDGLMHRQVTGTPQGGVLSPMLANVYLHRIDRVWDVREHGVLVRYADDVVIMCRSRRQAEDALAHLVGLLSDLGLGLEARLQVATALREGFGREFQVDRTTERQLNERFRKERRSLEELLGARKAGTPVLARGLEVLQRRSNRLVPIVAGLKELETAGRLSVPMAELAGSFLHMHANRMARSAARAQELVLYELLSRHHASQAARQRKTGPVG